MPNFIATKYIVTCQAHPVLIKIRQIRYAIRAFLNFCLVAAWAVRWRPRLAGTRQYTCSLFYSKILYILYKILL